MQKKCIKESPKVEVFLIHTLLEYMYLVTFHHMHFVGIILVVIKWNSNVMTVSRW